MKLGLVPLVPPFRGSDRGVPPPRTHKRHTRHLVALQPNIQTQHDQTIAKHTSIAKPSTSLASRRHFIPVMGLVDYSDSESAAEGPAPQTTATSNKKLQKHDGSKKPGK